MQRSFGLASTDAAIDPSHLGWKYHDQGPSWSGSRSFVLSDGTQPVAHAAIWPVQLQLPGGIRTGIGFGDWAASEEQRGAGLLLLKELKKLSSFVLVTGGAEITRQILPRMGFEHWADRARYARVLRPIRQAGMRRQALGWKEPARIARNTLWSLRPSAPVRNWTADESAPTPEALAPVQAQIGSIHTVAFFEHMLRSPAVRFKFLNLRQAGRLAGYSVLSFVGGQARIADLRIAPAPASDAQPDWNAALSAVLRTLHTETAACEVMAVGSVPHLDNALRANGFRRRGLLPLVVFDPEKQLAQQPIPQLGMLEDDAGLLRHPDFLT